MKFKIEKTTELKDTHIHEQPCKKAKLFRVEYPDVPENTQNIWTIEIDTIEELIKVLKECEKTEQKHYIGNYKLNGLVIKRTTHPEDMIKEYPFTIEVYNYWRE